METLDLVVSDVRQLTPHVRQLTLRHMGPDALPRAEAGAHLKVRIPGLEDARCYSLVLDAESCSHELAQEYRLGVRLESDGQGGSRYMHGLKPGDRVRASAPRNDFPLHADAAPALLLAGGIGITPLLGMAAVLREAGRDYVLHYCGASRAAMAYLPELEALADGRLHVHAGDEAGARLDVAVLLAATPRDHHIYVCGPRRLLDDVLAQAREHDWPETQLHFELFKSAAPQAGDQPFEIELRQSGQVLQVPADRTIADVLEEAGCDPMYDCKRGECGVCSVDVLEGVPDHRDYFLSDAEKASGKVIQICISRALTPRLVLDL